MSKLSEEIKKAIRQVYKHTCQYCGCDGANHVDHIFPQSKGGQHDLENLTLSCEACNLKKSDIILPEAGLYLMQGRAGRKKKKVEDLLEKWKRQKQRKLEARKKKDKAKNSFKKASRIISESTPFPGKWYWKAPDTFDPPIELIKRIISEDCPMALSEKEVEQLRSLYYSTILCERVNSHSCSASNIGIVGYSLSKEFDLFSVSYGKGFLEHLIKVDSVNGSDYTWVSDELPNKVSKECTDAQHIRFWDIYNVRERLGEISKSLKPDEWVYLAIHPLQSRLYDCVKTVSDSMKPFSVISEEQYLWLKQNLCYQYLYNFKNGQWRAAHIGLNLSVEIVTEAFDVGLCENKKIIVKASNYCEDFLEHIFDQFDDLYRPTSDRGVLTLEESHLKKVFDKLPARTGVSCSKKMLEFENFVAEISGHALTAEPYDEWYMGERPLLELD